MNALPNRWTPETSKERFFRYRVNYLPQQLEAARRKVVMLENEARRLGMTDLLEERA